MNNIFYQDLISGNNNPHEGGIIIKSIKHQRFENGIPVKGLQECNRNIIIQKNISGNRGYSVSIENPDSLISNFSIVMGSKPMEIVRQTPFIIELRGYGYDQNAINMGIPAKDCSFSDYGIMLIGDGSRNFNLEKCVLNMYDRNIHIDYYIE